MNLKEIQDNAPDGATHYYHNEAGGEEFIRYLKFSIEFNAWSIFCKERGLFFLVEEYDLYLVNKYSKPLHSENPTQEPKDPTNPSHYKQGKVECIDAIGSATVGKKGIEAVLVGNIIKYLWRYEEKNGVEDVEKAKCYLDKLLEKLK